MLTDFQKKWIEALRSGKYKQGKGALRACNKYCCLGVACDLLDPKLWIKDPEELSFKYKQCTSMPSLETLKEIGISYTFAYSLTMKNDCNWDFNKIADFIESELPKWGFPLSPRKSSIPGAK